MNEVNLKFRAILNKKLRFYDINKFCYFIITDLRIHNSYEYVLHYENGILIMKAFNSISEL
jgi:hypothetical protein